MEGFICDDSENEIEENDVHFYRQFDQEIEIFSDDDDEDENYFDDDDDDEIDEMILAMDEPEPKEKLSADHKKLFNIKLQKVEKCKKKLRNFEMELLNMFELMH